VIRDFRLSDSPRLVEMLLSQFPEEERILGTRPEMIVDVVKKVHRPFARLLVGTARLFRHPIFRLLVFDDGGRLVGTTLLSFPGPAVFIGMVMVDPTVRRRGFAKALLEQSREYARHLGRTYLALDVLEHNTPARSLYEGKLGYQPLRRTAFLVRDLADAGAVAPAPPIRPFRPRDERPLLAIARAQLPPEVSKVLPRRRTGLKAARLESAIFASQRAAWVIEGPAGPTAGLAVTSTQNMEAAQMPDPILAPDADPVAVSALIRSAMSWARANGSLRLMAQVPDHSRVGRAALEREGFHEELGALTLYRTVA
jgi:ribosomal protein S18 acetylase RimI-like enzyme